MMATQLFAGVKKYRSPIFKKSLKLARRNTIPWNERIFQLRVLQRHWYRSGVETSPSLCPMCLVMSTGFRPHLSRLLQAVRHHVVNTTPTSQTATRKSKAASSKRQSVNRHFIFEINSLWCSYAAEPRAKRLHPTQGPRAPKGDRNAS